MVTWIVCANQSIVKIFKCTGINHTLSFLWKEEHPQGRLHTMEIITDHPGAKRSSGHKLQATQTEETPKNHLAEQFALHIAKRLSDGEAQGKFDALVVCADPEFLGMLRQAFPPYISAKVACTVTKNLTSMTETEVFAQVKDSIVEAYRSRLAA